MKSKLINALAIYLLTIISGNSFATASHNTKGYTKKDGAFVKGHRATNPNKTQRDNWSSKPNSNPYTGKTGAKNPSK